jgi:hypothetical protein
MAAKPNQTIIAPISDDISYGFLIDWTPDMLQFYDECVANFGKGDRCMETSFRLDVITTYLESMSPMPGGVVAIVKLGTSDPKGKPRIDPSGVMLTIYRDGTACISGMTTHCDQFTTELFSKYDEELE